LEESAFEIDETTMAPELENMNEAERLTAEAQNRERTFVAKDKAIRDQANKIITKMLGQRCPRDNWGSHDLKEKDRTEEEMATPAKKRTRDVAVEPIPLGGKGSGSGRKRWKQGHTKTAEEERAILDSVEALKRRRKEKQQEESKKMAEERAERERLAAIERKKREEINAEKKKKAAVIQKAADQKAVDKAAKRKAAMDKKTKKAAGRGKSSRGKNQLSEEIVRDDSSSEEESTEEDNDATAVESDSSSSLSRSSSESSSDGEDDRLDEEGGDKDDSDGEGSTVSVVANEKEAAATGGGDEEQEDEGVGDGNDVTDEGMEGGEEGAVAPAAAEETGVAAVHGDGDEERALNTRKGGKGKGDGGEENVPVRRSARLA